MRQLLLLALTMVPLASPALAEGSQTVNGSVTSSMDDPRDIARRVPVIPVLEASRIALKRVPGTVTHAELETNDGLRTWQVDIQPQDGRPVRMWLNANTGAFLRMVRP